MGHATGTATHWLDVVGDLLQRPLTCFPHTTIGDELTSTFDVVGTTWNWRNADGSKGSELSAASPQAFAEISETINRWNDTAVIDRHPLIRWFAATGTTEPQTIGRVPEAIAQPSEWAEMDEVLRAIDCDVQLSIPYALNGVEHRAFVLARTGDDFDDEDLLVARSLQPLFRGLDRQSRVLATFGPIVAESAKAVDLTGRETAVLGLLAAGHTAGGIARRLTISPRTVNKHLERIYRKLGVSDRLGAVRLASVLDLLDPHRSDRATPGAPRMVQPVAVLQRDSPERPRHLRPAW